jgi:serine/threonine-protein kinase
MPLLVFAALAGWLLVDIAILWPSLPERLATHFGFSGEPNGWSTPAQFVRSTTTLLAVFGVLFVSAGWLERMPDRLINLPNKHYWLAPERRSATMATVRDWLRWFLVLLLTFLAVTITAVLRANLSGAPRLYVDPMFAVPALLVPLLAMIGWLYWRFRTPRG